MTTHRKRQLGRRILGVDPGSQVTGFGVIEDRGDTLACLTSGTIRTTKARAGDNQTNLPKRLGIIHDGLNQLVSQYRPQIMVVESVFHARNAQSALKLGQARGVALLVGAQHGLEVFEYSPRAVKKGITGSGAATKSQVERMVKVLLHGKVMRSLDATDALALAIYHCHLTPWLRHTKSSTTALSPHSRAERRP